MQHDEAACTQGLDNDGIESKGIMMRNENICVS